MRLIAIALAALSLAACATTQPPTRTEFVSATLDAELAQQCIGRIRQSDVPTVPEGHTRPLDHDTAIYVRKLEDGYEICERVVREGLAVGQQVPATNN